MKVEWDENKNLQNQSKHGISFEEAQDLFLSGAEYLEVFDWEHSEREDRFIAIGPLSRGVVVVVWPRGMKTRFGLSVHAQPLPAKPDCTKHTWNNTCENHG